ncbi:hypothetical protein [Paenibacillus bovis]|uniref:DUF4320 domain-containing protein n=1 Tax=Paenibacillus bovis TaxID=1616788 RepID=A0A1X9T4I4_9BACL|nr:hypothetical protein [Paenibacillus bovis]ARR10742.1 hypothetical protein AR543_p0134 [Paenibacillus bovis]
MTLVKWIFILFFGILGTGLLVDYLAVTSGYESVGRSMEQSLDSGIIASEYISDASKGTVSLDVEKLKKTIHDEFQQNMKLDANLENDFYKNTTFIVEYKYDANGKPWIQMKLHTQVSFMFKNIISYPINAERNIAYEAVYM